jgi:hypothetical protein
MSDDQPYRDVVEHLNRVVALSDLSIPSLLTSVPAAALFLLKSHREHGTQIRMSVYDYALALEAAGG